MERILSQRIKSRDAEIAYWMLGDGPPVVLLTLFPLTMNSGCLWPRLCLRVTA